MTPISIASLPAELDPDYSGSGLGGSGHQLINLSPPNSQSPSPTSRYDLKQSSIKGRFVKSGESGANQMVVKVTPMEVKNLQSFQNQSK